MLQDNQLNYINSTILTYGDVKNAKTLLIQPVDSYDQEHLEEEFQLIQKLSGRKDFRLMAFPVHSWSEDLAPWPAPPVFGDEPFGGGAAETLRRIEDELQKEKADTVFIGGYSLAGFFALWATYQTDKFNGAAAVSPSVWYPGWIEYAETHPCRADSVYLSLGKKEEKTRNQTMAKVGDCIRRQRELLEGKALLEWNEGNHFLEPARRTAKGFAWLLKQAPIYTERLVIKPISTEDLESTFAYGGDPETTRLMVFLPFESLDETKLFLEEAAKEWRKPEPTYYEFGVWKDDVHIGAVSLYLYNEGRSGELGWIFNKAYQHQGYAIESARALKQYAEKVLHIKHFQAHCDAENVASSRIMEQLGMHRTSTHGGRHNKQSAEERMEYFYES